MLGCHSTMKSGSELSFKGFRFGEDGDIQVSAHIPPVSLKILNFTYKTNTTWKGMERCTQAGEPGLREQHSEFSEVLFDPPVLDLKAKTLALWTCQQTQFQWSLLSLVKRPERRHPSKTQHFLITILPPVECHRNTVGPAPAAIPKGFASLDFGSETAVMRDVEANQFSH